MLQLAIVVVGVLLFLMGLKGFTKAGIPLSKTKTLTDQAGRNTGVACIVAATAILAGDGWWFYDTYKKQGAQQDKEERAAENERKLQEHQQASHHHIGGQLLLQTGNYEGAVEAFTKAIQLNPENYRYHSDRGTARLGQGNFRAALSDYNKAASFSPKDFTVYLNRGLCHIKLGNAARAKQDLTAALNLKSNDQDVLLNLSWLCATCPNRAVRDSTKAVELALEAQRSVRNPQWEHFAILAAACGEEGDFERARIWQKRALDAVPAEEKSRLMTVLLPLNNSKPVRDNEGTIWALPSLDP